MPGGARTTTETVPALRVGFAGTPEFARIAFDAICAAGYTVPLVLTQPDRPAGRGLQLQASPVKQAALRHGATVLQPRSLRRDGKFAADAAAAQDALRAADLGVLVVAAYGLLLPQWVLDLPRRGCLNIHGSLLPRWRGAAPIQRAIEAGDRETGITIMQMDAGLDTGAVLLREPVAIGAAETSASLHDTLATAGAALLVKALSQLGSLQPTPQPDEGVTHARKIDKAEAMIDWSLPAAVVERRLRAFDPFPGCSVRMTGAPVKLWRASVAPGQGAPGTVLRADAGGLLVACGGGTALQLLELQRTGGRRMPAAAFLRGHPLAVGDVLVGEPS